MLGLTYSPVLVAIGIFGRLAADGSRSSSCLCLLRGLLGRLGVFFASYILLFVTSSLSVLGSGHYVEQVNEQLVTFHLIGVRAERSLWYLTCQSDWAMNCVGMLSRCD